MKLQPSPKTAGGGVHRVVSTEQTWTRIEEFIPRIGITRLASIDGLDRIGIPVYSAIMPRSQDLVSVYNGKGTTALDAKVGSVMEAIERYAAWSSREPDVFGSYVKLSDQRTVLHPSQLIIDLGEDFHDHATIPWIEGFDLVRQESVLVPFAAAAYFQDRGQFGTPCYALTSTNGLASGNTLEEAICHAMCEVIERDAVTMAELLSRGLPNLLRKSDKRTDDDGGDGDDLDRFPTIDLDSLSGTSAALRDQYFDAGIRPVVRNVTADNGIATVACTITDDLHPAFSMAHTGVGTHPDAEVALVRSLTEAAQARVSDIQGLREDISMAADDIDSSARHAQRVAKVDSNGWYHRESADPMAFSAVATQRNPDVLGDITCMIDGLVSHGTERVIVVDLSPSDVDAAVVRVLVPFLETWSALKGRVGPRAEATLRAEADRRSAATTARENARRFSELLGGLPGSES